ncbi:expressed unknown protein [Seminavis robusta]|uniref:Uncharacterized protein n=1 Tax=Seminavis robusta TaxID=568900 RepID=A0A9N8H9C4_9STRA|nr:expressed unknown protein [Seminavis robusta]|eukprot:Sro186_g080780.1 n/a (83) ;mRNA; f:87759-88007
MKTTAALVLLSALSASAFVPAAHKPSAQSALRVTPEEDMELTRKVIAKFFGDDMSEPAPAPAAPAAEPEEAPKKKKSKKSKN